MSQNGPDGGQKTTKVATTTESCTLDAAEAVMLRKVPRRSDESDAFTHKLKDPNFGL